MTASQAAPATPWLLAGVAFAVFATHLTVLWWRGRRHREAVGRGETRFVVQVSERVGAELGREVTP